MRDKWVPTREQRVAYNATQAEKVKERRRLVGDYKVAQGCTDCGYNEHAIALDFDHVRGEKLFEIGRGANRNLEALAAEMEKCEVVCSNCHRVRTAARRNEVNA